MRGLARGFGRASRVEAPRRARGRLALAVVTALAGSRGVLAAQESGDTLRLTLAEALEVAEGGNPAYRQASNDVLLNGVEMRTTWLDDLLPKAQLTLFNTAFTGNLQRRAFDNYGNPIENPSADWRYFSRTSQALSLTWNVQGQSLFQAHREQALVNRQRDAARTVALTDLQVGVERLYMDALRQRDLMRAEEELIDARRIDLDAVQRLFGLALRSRVDVLNAQLEVEQQSLNASSRRADYERALLALRAELGEEDDRPIDLAEADLPVFDPSALDAEALVESALEVNPSLRQSAVALRSADLAVGRSKNTWWPRITFRVDLFKVAQADRTDAFFRPSTNGGLEGQFQLGVDIPFFNNYAQNQLAIERASVERDNQREIDRDARLEVEKNVRGGVLELSNQWETLRLAQRSQEIAEEALRLTREEYRLGTKNFQELRAAFQQQAETRRQVIGARHDFVDALLTLEQAVGAPVRGSAPPAAAGGR